MSINRDRLLLYAVTDRSGESVESFYKKIEEALLGGVTILQLREKNISFEDYLHEAMEVKRICDSYKVPLIINDNVDVALMSGASGVHVGSTDESVAKIRKRVPADFIIGATAKTVEQARLAQRDGADYLGVGAVFPSPTKKDAVRITAKELKNICESVEIPAVAIGGISPLNVQELKGGRLAGIAVVSAIFGADDVTLAARSLYELSLKVTEYGGGQ